MYGCPKYSIFNHILQGNPKKYSLMRKLNLNHHMIKRIADTVIATFIMFGVAIISPLLFAAYKEAKHEEDWFRDILDKT